MAASADIETMVAAKEYRYTTTRKGSPRNKVFILCTVGPVGTLETEYCMGGKI